MSQSSGHLQRIGRFEAVISPQLSRSPGNFTINRLNAQIGKIDQEHLVLTSGIGHLLLPGRDGHFHPS
jgi:hypothetical protein